ncbi:MAG: DUF2148 domain-containing protein [Christensenellaceae bacterium]|nr:DUF2148 domain-containing protein [Christensenellaceae bacterium]
MNMAIHPQTEFARESVLAVARDMANAARTAPKAKGVDRLHIIVIEGDTLHALAAHMREMHASGRAAAHFARDAGNLEASDACLLVATEIGPMPSGCADCGMRACANNQAFMGAPCVYATHDLGLAIGSAVALAADRRIDNRVMFSVGEAAYDLGFLPVAARIAMGIPLSATGKNPYYDRKPS